MRNSKFFSNTVSKHLPEDLIAPYRKSISIVYFLFGIILPCMGMIEHYQILQGNTFLSVYVALCLVPFSFILFSNKKYLGTMFPWRL